MRFISATLALVMFVTSIAPTRAFAAPEPAAPWGEPEERRAELDLRTYFEGCNNYIDKTLENWGCERFIPRTLGTCGLKRDAGDRPTPLMMMGMATETEASGDTPFSAQQIRETDQDLGVEFFLKSMYVQSLANSVSAYVRLLVQYEFVSPSPTLLTNRICSLGAGCSKPAREFVEKLLLDEIPKAIEQVAREPRFTNEYIARTMNEEIGKANYWLAKLPRFRLDQKPTEEQLFEYTRSFITSATTNGPMRLITVPSIYEKVGFLSTPQNLNRDIIKEWPDPRFYPADALYIQMPVAYRVKAHGYVQPADIAKAVPEAHAMIEGVIGKLHDKVAIENAYDHKTQQAAVTELIGTNALAANAALRKYYPTRPELAASACRAFRDFAIERAQAKKSARYKANLVLGIGVVLALSGAVVPFLAPAWVAVVYGVSAAVATAIAYDSWKAYTAADRKLETNVAAVLTDNESAEVIITRIPEQIRKKDAALKDAWINAGAAVLSGVFVVKQIWFTAAAPAVTGAALTQAETIVGAKTLFAASKMTPIAIDAWQYADFQQFRDQVVDLESPPRSGIMIHAKVITFDKTRDRVVLEIKNKTGPDGREMDFDRKNPQIRVPIALYREAIAGFKMRPKL